MKTMKIALSVLVIISYMLIIASAISGNTSDEIYASEQITSTNQTIAESFDSTDETSIHQKIEDPCAKFTLAPLNPEFLEYQNRTVRKDIPLCVGMAADGHILGLIPHPVDLSHLGNVDAALTYLGYSDSYDLRSLGNVTPVRNQGSAGSCWAHATYASLESYLLPAETWDFSENNMKNLLSSLYPEGFDRLHSGGGNHLMSTAYLARWSGPINESDDPYNASKGVSPSGLTATKHVQDVLIVPKRNNFSDNDNIKWAIENYGAVYSTMNFTNSYYNSTNHTYYFYGSDSANHAIAIVGWNDSFDRNKFPSVPSGNGAFIIKNSWGTDFGDNGYFYISYYDSVIGIDNAIFTAEELNNYDYVYQHDPLGWTTSCGYGINLVAWAANIFTAQTDESLEAVSFYTTDSNVDYELYLYRDPVSGPINTTGPIATKTGTISLPGYHTISLNSGISINQGQKFSVVVKFTNPTYTNPIAIEYPYDDYSSKATANTEESYLSSDGTTWTDITTTTTTFENTSICIKAFTKKECNPPSASGEMPLNGSLISNTTPLISVNITDYASGVNLSSVVMTVNGSIVDIANTSIPGGYMVYNQTTVPFTNAQVVNVSVTASDNASNSMTYNWSFTIDTTLPIVTIQYPTEYLVIQTSTLNLNITTNETCDIWYCVDDGDNSSEVRGVTFNTMLSQLNDSHYNITAFARDLAGNLNSTMVNFTIFATPPVVSVPAAGEIFYIPQNTTYVNGTTTTIVTNVSVYVNSVLVNESHPVIGGMFNISGVPLVNGTNTINVTAIYNYTATEYFSENTSLTVCLGQIFDEIGDTITIDVPGLAQEIKPPFIDFNITGQGNNIPYNISSSVVAAASAPPASNLTGPAIDFSVPGNESYTFDNSISLTLGFNASSVVDFNKTVVAWYNESTATWVSLKSTVNTTANTTTANVTHFTVFAPLEDNTPPVNITALTSTGQTTSSITLSWTNSSDTDYVEIWKSNSHLTNVSATSYTDIGLSSNTPYTYALRPVDIVGNKGNWSNVTVSTTSPPPPPPSGGGGGGGGGSTGEEYENIEFKDVSRVYISANTDVSFIFSEAGNAIGYIDYRALTSQGYISATIEVLKDTSALVKQAPTGKVYKNMNIWLGKFGYATEYNIENPVIGFKVQRSWIQDNHIDADSIKLNRYSEDVWTALPTTRTDEDTTFIYFESQTPGFSPFAITAQEKALISKVSVKSETAAEPLLPVEEQPVETTTPASEIESVEETSMWGNLLIGAFILTIIAGAYLYMRKRQG